MGHSFLVAAEGQTDFDTLHLIIDAVSKDLDVDCSCKMVFPEYDATSSSCGKGGWSRFMHWVKALNGTTQPAHDTSERDKELWEKAGFTGPTKTSPASWELMLALDDSMLILHLDGDVANEIGTHHPDGPYSNDIPIYTYCKKALYAWSGLTSERAICAIPVQCMESWYLTLHSLDDCKFYCQSIENYESTPTADVYTLLCKLGHKNFIDDNGESTVDKIELPKKYGSKLIARLDELCAACPSALCFVNDLEQVF